MNENQTLTKDEFLYNLKLYRETKDANAIETLIKSNQGLVYYVAKKYYTQSQNSSLIDFDDILQAGNIGLYLAITKYDESFNTEFSTYAIYWIRQFITRLFPSSNPQISLSVYSFEKLVKIKTVAKEYYNKYNKHITYKRLCEICPEMREPHSKSIWQFFQLSFISLDAEVRLHDEDEGNTNSILITYEEKSFEDKIIEKIMLDNYLNSLSERDRDIVYRHQVLGYALGEIAKDYNISPERARQLEERALEKLKSQYRWENLLEDMNT